MAAQPFSDTGGRSTHSVADSSHGGSTELPPIPARSPFARASGREKPQTSVNVRILASTRPPYESTRPSPGQNPNNYRSEFAPRRDQHLQPSTATDQEQAQAQRYHPASPPSAVESLNYAQSHDTANPAIRSLPAANLGTSLQRRTSRTSMKSTSSAKALLKPHSDLTQVSQAVDSVVTPSSGYEKSREDPSQAIPLDSGPQVQPPIHQLTMSTKDQSQLHEPVNGSQISDLLAKLPPIKQITMENSAERPLVIDSAGNIPRPQSIHEHSRELSSRDDDEERNLPTKAVPEDRIIRRPKTSNAPKSQSPSVPGTPASSASHRAASLTRVITALSEISSKSSQSRLRLPPLNISKNYERLDDSNVESQAPKSAWVRTLLSRSSTTATKEMPNLTAGPSQRGGHAASTPEQGRARTMPFLQTSSVTHNENAHHGQAEADSVKALDSKSRQLRNAESFSEAISNLENLLQEALSIAHQAADDDELANDANKNHNSLPATHGQPQGISQYRAFAKTKNSPADFSGTASRQVRSITEHSSDVEDREMNGDWNNANVEIRVVEPESEDDHGHFKKARDKTPYPAATRNPSIVPPADEDLSTANLSSLQGRLVVMPPNEPSIARSQTQSMNQDGLLRPVASKDWALVKRRPTMKDQGPDTIPLLPRQPTAAQAPLKEHKTFLARETKPSYNSKSIFRPSNQPRASSFRLRPKKEYQVSSEVYEMDKVGSSGEDFEESDVKEDLKDVEKTQYENLQKATGSNIQAMLAAADDMDTHRESAVSPLPGTRFDIQDQGPSKQGSIRKGRRSHFNIKEPHGFSLSRSHRRAPIARDWSTSRKRWTATIACLSTALIGLIIGIYAGEVPAIQYAIVDEHHYTILGNVVFFIGLAITTVLCFPLPVLHGRKPYTLAALAILMPLQFPQALAVNTQRTPSVATYRIGLLVPRAIAGLVMGFANINFLATLLDLFGASLQSSNPHQEVVDVNDVRRHGGGMGMWLGIWTWCFIGSLGVGFFIGAVIISGLDVSWGFWITIILTAAVLVLNVLVPEVRRSAYRRSLAEVRNGGEVSRRIARGEMKMHLDATGPIYWWEEVTAGLRICARMLQQPGFVVLSLYLGWIYGQIVLVIVLLGALTSKYYHFRPQYVGLCVAAIPIGALLATPFQKASVLSRSRTHKPRTDSMTFEKRVSRSSHLVRRTIFMILLPFADLAYTLSSGGAHTHYMVPTFFAGTIGFFSNLAIAECNGIIMETYDTSDLQAGMTGRPRRVLPDEIASKRTNFSCFPRVTAAFAISQAVAYLIAAAGTGTGGAIERRLGAQTATAVVAGILLVLTLLLIAILTRFRTVQIIPTQRYGTAILSGPENEWKP
ncbi:MAG: hypothetical protein Q9191_000095 [Dirinaria sp. TL-2023a]